MKTRADKKFNINLWVPKTDKDIFRLHCFEHHVSMMFIGEKYLTICLDAFNDPKLDDIIEANHDEFLGSLQDSHEKLGIRVTNKYWQKLAYFAVRYHSTVAKIASCIFNYGLGAVELQNVQREYGLEFTRTRRDRFKGNVNQMDERLSDW